MADPRYHIQVEVVTEYLPDQSAPAQNHYLFSYTITIRNRGTLGARLLGRHWIIFDANCQEREVRGAGVVGEQPHLAPGTSYVYTSCAPLPTPVGGMRGSYQMIADDGARFDAPIPPFMLAGPVTVH
ncbi:MAG: Co2+/Mg2+ efflux protein ApaG [Magnetococcus sp. WYHC-3]